jgi:A/G-specific adenine glycosylase
MIVSGKLEMWYYCNKRDLPWRNSVSAYHIWLSEIILQQTRVNQGLEYYNKFVERFPHVEDLARAPIDEVLKLWQGLGYYTRARNLHATAQIIVNEYNGSFPWQYKELLKLKGIGAYTAAAIASIAFKEPVALVDGNVFRVLSRLYGIDTPIDTLAGKNVFTKIASEILNPDKPDIHNQALMEFGALVCLYRNPHCEECILAKLCKARIDGTVEILPVKVGKSKIHVRYFNYLFIQHNGKTYLNKRNSKDIWNSLFEFPLVETNAPLSFSKLILLPPWNHILGSKPVKPHGRAKTYKHQLTHQTLYCCFYIIKMNAEPVMEHFNYLVVSLNHINEYAVPKAIDRYLEDLRYEGLL